jgi:NitT/TauT family transport system ATP-binding protein
MTPRPGTIGAEIPVPLPYPRSPDLRFAPELVSIVREVAEAMRGHAVEAA